MPRYTNAFRERVRQDYLTSGDTYDVLAERYGIGRTTIYNWCKGLLARKTKLTEDDIPVIKQRYLAGENTRELAEDYKVSRATILSVINGRTWKDIK